MSKYGVFPESIPQYISGAGWRSYTSPTHVSGVAVASAGRRRLGSSNPAYRQMILNRYQAGTYFSAAERVVEFSGSAHSYRASVHDNGPPGNEVHMRYHTADGYEVANRVNEGVPGDPFPATPQSLINMVNAKAINRIYDALRLIDAGVVAGELGETIRMIRSPAKGLQNALGNYLDRAKSLRPSRRGGNARKNRQDAERALKDLYLEKQWGWDSLMRDTKSAAEALAEQREKIRFYSKPFSASGQENGPLSSSETLNAFTLPLPFQYYCTAVETKKEFFYRVKGAVTRRLEPRMINPSLWGLSLNDFAPTVYNLIPWSFVVDYFSNLGDVINSLSYPSKEVSWLIATKRYHAVKTFICRAGAYVGPSDGLVSILAYDVRPGNATVTTWANERTPLSSDSLYVSIETNLPSPKQLVNLEALRGRHDNASKALRRNYRLRSN